MITQQLLAEVLDSQNENWLNKDQGVIREKLDEIKIHPGFACIITGVRRCGKSTLMRQLLSKVSENSLFLNFEDPRLTAFENDDFRRLDNELNSRKIKNLFLDEVQMLDNWELYVRQKLDEDFKVVVTGSNASLLSRELGTKLTGRHQSFELFPFSMNEYLTFKKKKISQQTMADYMEEGGFPDFLKFKDASILQHLLNDILMRDIAVRYGVRDSVSLQRLAVYLISNIGRSVSANNLSKLFQIKATSTLLEYFSFLEDAYLVQFVSKFSYSQKVQIRNPKKVYSIDLGLFSHNTTNFTENSGWRLENLVYLHYRRIGREIYYFSEKRECDFVIFNNGKIEEVVQVCYEINQDNLKREIDGLKEAMDFFGLKKGSIVTFNQEDSFDMDGSEINLKPLKNLLS